MIEKIKEKEIERNCRIWASNDIKAVDELAKMVCERETSVFSIVAAMKEDINLFAETFPGKTVNAFTKKLRERIEFKKGKA